MNIPHTRLVYTCAVGLLAASFAWSQSFQGGIRGSVADTGGGVIPDAKVSLIDEATNTSRATLTNTAGEYVFNAVNPATYTVSVESPGFKKFERKGVIVATQQFVTLDLKLDSYQLFNLSAGLEFDSGLEFVLYVNNVFDENAKLAFDRERGGRARLGYHVGTPRTVGLTVRHKFGN